MADFAAPGDSRPSRGTGNVSANFDATDMTAFTASVLATEHPAVIATAGLHADFMQAYIVHSTSQDVLTLIEKYASLCEGYLSKVRKVTEILASRKGQPVWMEAITCETLLTIELNTWMLTGSLLRDRLKADELMKEDADTTIFVDGSREASEWEIVEALMARDSFARRAQLVVDWLESCVAHQRGVGNDDERLECFAGRGSVWKNTLHHVKACADVGSAPSSYVTELDPDTPSRERLPINNRDYEDEVRLFRSVFFHLRAGQWQRAQELAADNGHYSLAAALEDWRPYHDPNNGSIMGADSMQPARGNLYQNLSKRACWEAASNPTCSLYERAVYGALCGNVQAMLPVCTTWEDKLWARMRAVVDVCVEQKLRTAMQQARSLEPQPPDYPCGRGMLEAVFRDLQAAAGVGETRGQKITHILQRGLVLDEAVSTIEEIHDWVSAQVIEPPLLFMRFLAHMVLFLRQVGRETDTGACSALFCTYVDRLFDEGHVPFVSTHAATPPASNQAAKYTQLAQPQNERPRRTGALP
ncbi:nuclear pore complex protein Nup107 [Rhipicephalus microplus]|uniref:nuclear pore complex protein Nup107 n=1 Tax=Rhipicephalus microplus TaxID=6941 RepID=UPI003F6D3502